MQEKVNALATYSHAIQDNIGSYHGQQLAAANAAEADLEQLVKDITDQFEGLMDDMIGQQEGVLGI